MKFLVACPECYSVFLSDSQKPIVRCENLAHAFGGQPRVERIELSFPMRTVPLGTESGLAEPGKVDAGPDEKEVLQRHVREMWLAHSYLCRLLNTEYLSVQQRAELNDIIEKVKAAGSALGKFHVKVMEGWKQ